jgi:NDP-4-keto-2,6-dideoxyhexose 3-C-methyltransferase
MLVATAFDDICHEHLFYPSLAAIARMVAPFDLAIIDAELRSINGGSLRLTIGRRWRPVSSRVWALSVAEYGCEQPATLRVFADKVDLTRLTIQEMIKQSDVIDLYGASTKGNTLLQVCGLGPGQIRQAWERSPEKWGRHTITGIPIVSEADGRADPPAMLFVGIWQFREAIIQREAEYLARGGRLLFPLPQVEVIDGVREHLGARSDTAAIG